MKSSLAHTFLDAFKGESSKDRIFPGRVTLRHNIDENGEKIEGKCVMVVLPYVTEYRPPEKTSTLLVDAGLRREYERLHINIDDAKEALLKAVRRAAKSRRRNFENEITSAFTSSDDFQVAVTRIKDELEKQKDMPFANIEYKTIFNEKILDLHFSPRGEAKCVRGPSGLGASRAEEKGASRLARAGVLPNRLLHPSGYETRLSQFTGR